MPSSRHPLSLSFLAIAVITTGYFAGLFDAIPVSADSKPFYRSILSLPSNGKNATRESLTKIGFTPGSQFGAVFARGDVNGDAYDDILISSPYYSTPQLLNRGRVDIYLGGKEFFREFEMGVDRKADVVILGARAESQLGTSLVTGDINTDGIADVAIGAPGDKVVSVLFGGRDLSAGKKIDLTTSSVDWRIEGKNDDERFGFSLDMADMNADRTNDLIVGAPFAGRDGVKRVGKVYVVFGKTGMSPGVVTYLNYSAGHTVFWGLKEDDRFGITLAHGDIDGDKKVDLAVGSYMASHEQSKQSGTVTIFYGSEVGLKEEVQVENEKETNNDEESPKSSGVSEKSNETLLSVDRNFDWLGYGLAVGDLNSDGVDDLVMSSWPYLKNTKQGQISILWGEKGARFDGKRLSRVIAPDETALIGTVVGISDMNADGALDLIVGGATGAPGSDRNFGRLYILSFFPRNRELWNFSKIPADMMIEGRETGDWFGNSYVTGDFDNDGNKDLVVGAPNTKKNGSVELLRGPLFPRGEVSYTLPSPEEFVNRGSFIVRIIKAFKLESKNREFINSCLESAEFCFYQFSSQTKYAGLRFTPHLRLYPDVKPIDPFYSSVNIATILGIIRGFSDEPNSPFHPAKPISRIHALKILLTSTGMLPWKDYSDFRRELLAKNGFPLGKSLAIGQTTAVREIRDKDPITSQKTPYKDISAYVAHMWWYPRYVNFAYLSGIIEDSVFFQPDAPLTQKDFETWMKKIKAYQSVQADEPDVPVNVPTEAPLEMSVQP